MSGLKLFRYVAWAAVAALAVVSGMLVYQQTAGNKNSGALIEPLAAIGGGTGLATQSEALEMLGVVPDSSRPGAAVMRLAEILGASVLAGELSLLAALSSRDLARAHERLGRSNAKS